MELSEKNILVYETKIYEFDYEEIQTNLKQFLLNNPNLLCMIKVKFKIIPD
jgi:hypothetical protein